MSRCECECVGVCVQSSRWLSVKCFSVDVFIYSICSFLIVMTVIALF